MRINQESLLMILVPNSAITITNTIKKLTLKRQWERIFLRSFEKSESYIKLNIVLNISAFMQNYSSNNFNISSIIINNKASNFISDNGVLTMFCFLKTIKNQIFNCHLYLWVLEGCPDESFKDCHRQTPKPVVWIHSQKGQFLSQWVGLNCNKINRN